MRQRLETCYHRYNRQRFLGSDPVQILYEYPEFRDREVAGLIASSLSYGRVKSIQSSVRSLLSLFGASPYAFLKKASPDTIRKTCSGFRHRFTGPDDIARLLTGTQELLRSHNTIGSFIKSVHSERDGTYYRAMCALAEEISGSSAGISHLLPSPAGGSACKRICLYFRWMIRHDNIDPGGWEGLSNSALVVPLDVHMLRICRKLGLTRRKTACWKMALEVTEAFRSITPEDPVKYDFALTRASMFEDPLLGSIPDIS